MVCGVEGTSEGGALQVRLAVHIKEGSLLGCVALLPWGTTTCPRFQSASAIVVLLAKSSEIKSYQKLEPTEGEGPVSPPQHAYLHTPCYFSWYHLNNMQTNVFQKKHTKEGHLYQLLVTS